jgi:aminoglycoside phosphotransferase (APT) family kinase protein
MPAAEIEVSPDLVRSLLAEQHPDLAALPLELIANGWDNVIYRLGDHLVARMPRRQLGADLVEHEQRWLPELAERLPIPIPAPVRDGRPGVGYPWAWSVCPWFDGVVAADSVLADPIREARRLGGFVAAMHVPAPADAPFNQFRGQPMAELVERIGPNIDRVGDVIDRRGVDDLLARLAGTPDWEGPPLWLHGDLHTANVLVEGGAIAAVIDLGDITSGDPAVDLAIAWMMFDGQSRVVFRESAGSAAGVVDDATWQRGRLWALHFSLLYLLHSADNERFARMGTQLLAAVLADEGT